jgi:hypothetical protein
MKLRRRLLLAGPAASALAHVLSAEAADPPSWYIGPTWRGIDYSPTWPSWVVGRPGTQTADSDFANDAFAALWSDRHRAPPAGDPSVPADNGGTYRDDLATIAGLGFNLVRLYDWDMARGTSATQSAGLDHINFLDRARSLGLKVVVPVSDYFLGDDRYAWSGATPPVGYGFDAAPESIRQDFSQFVASIVDPATGRLHAAVHSISVGNEGDIGQGIGGANPSNFLARTLWWICNLHRRIAGATVPLSATFSNADQAGGSANPGSWFKCLIEGVSAGQRTPSGWPGGGTFPASVTGLAASDPGYAGYYYNSLNISQLAAAPPYGNGLAETVAAYDAGASPWPGGKFDVPLMLMEVFTSNRSSFKPPTDQAVAAVGQARALEAHLLAHHGGAAQSTTNLMGYNYFQFNDEQQLKLTGLFQYGPSSANARTGTTSLFYGTFPDMTFPVVPLAPTPGPDGKGTLAKAWTACFP